MKSLLLCVLLFARTLGADWPGVKFDEVRAYYYNDAGAFDIPIIKNGKLNPGAENPEGKILSREQTERLLKTLNTKRFEAVEPGCFVPRHAFVFYDEHKNVVATYEVCIHCHTQRGIPAGLAPVTDLDAIAALLVELKLNLEASYETKEGAWREKWDPSKLVPFDEKTSPRPTHLDQPKPEVPLKVPAATVGSRKYPEKRFSPWIEKDPRRYAGAYKERSNDSELATTITLKLTLSGTEWLANGTERMWKESKPLNPERQGQIWDEPLTFGKVVNFSQNGLYSYIFCRFRRDDGKVLKGLVILGRFYEKQK